MQAYFQQLAANIRWADVLDIGVIAVLSYCGLSWFRQRASRSLGIGLVLVLALFLCARWLDMYLTTMLFQFGLTAVLLALIVVFQQDIRRAFERLAASGIFRRSRQPKLTSEVIDTLVESVATLAENHTGALLIFEGREPLDRHVRGGVAVDKAGCPGNENTFRSRQSKSMTRRRTMRFGLFAGLISAVLLVTAGCDDSVTQKEMKEQRDKIAELEKELENARNNNDSAEKIKELETKLAEERDQLTALQERRTCEEEMNQNLREMDKKIDSLQDKAADAEGEREIELRKKIAELRTRYDQLQRRFDDMKAASGDTWVSMKVEVEDTWKTTSKPVDEAIEDAKSSAPEATNDAKSSAEDALHKAKSSIEGAADKGKDEIDDATDD